jgi:hypothetical protein
VLFFENRRILTGDFPVTGGAFAVNHRSASGVAGNPKESEP